LNLLPEVAAAVLVAAAVTLPPPGPSLAGIQAVRAADLPPMTVGVFTAAPGKPTRMDKAVQVRIDSQRAPPGGYAKYLGDTLAAQLRGAGRFDPEADIVISGVITDTHVESNTPLGRARLAARFTVQRGGVTVYEKDLNVSDVWRSNYMAVIAVPDAFNHYTALFLKLSVALVSDPEFVAAVKGAPA